jgi:hypothetical protein
MSDPEIISREDAIKLGLTQYYTGKPCKYGHLCSRMVSGRRCVECSKIACRKWHYQNKDKVLLKNKKWEDSNPDKVKKHASDCYKKHKSKRLAGMKEWAHKNPEKIKEIRRKYVDKNKEKARARLAKRRSLKIKATPSWLTEEQLSDIKLAYEVAVELEKKTGIKYHVDHIVPLRGKNVCGLHVPWNLQAIPAEENLRKSNKLDD